MRLSVSYFNTLDISTKHYANNGKIEFNINVDYEHSEEHLKNFVRALNNIVTEDAINEQEFELENIVEFVVKNYGKIDILVNNAGIVFDREFEEITYEEMKTMLSKSITRISQINVSM